jgi:hypothetical protein
MAGPLLFRGRHMAQPFSPNGDAIFSHAMPPSPVCFDHMANHHGQTAWVNMKASNDTRTSLVTEDINNTMGLTAARR